MNNDLEYDAVIEVVSELAIYKEGSLALPFWVKVPTKLGEQKYEFQSLPFQN